MPPPARPRQADPTAAARKGAPLAAPDEDADEASAKKLALDRADVGDGRLAVLPLPLLDAGSLTIGSCATLPNGRKGHQERKMGRPGPGAVKRAAPAPEASSAARAGACLGAPQRRTALLQPPPAPSHPQPLAPSMAAWRASVSPALPLTRTSTRARSHHHVHAAAVAARAGAAAGGGRRRRRRRAAEPRGELLALARGPAGAVCAGGGHVHRGGGGATWAAGRGGAAGEAAGREGEGRHGAAWLAKRPAGAGARRRRWSGLSRFGIAWRRQWRRGCVRAGGSAGCIVGWHSRRAGAWLAHGAHHLLHGLRARWWLSSPPGTGAGLRFACPENAKKAPACRHGTLTISAIICCGVLGLRMNSCTCARAHQPQHMRAPVQSMPLRGRFARHRPLPAPSVVPC